MSDRKLLHFLISFLGMLTFQLASAQELEYARKVIATLSSDEMKGRGYVEKGDRRAAEYLAGEFENAVSMNDGT